MSRTSLAAALCVLSLLAPHRAAAFATFEINVLDGPGEGFNDDTPVTPVGGNTGTTLGEQRLNALQYAADLWGQAIDSEQVIKVDATYDPIECVGGFSTTLALGGTVYLDFLPTAGGGELVYPTALADRITGEDLHPGAADISIQFNVNVDSGTCLTGIRWYYGFDGNPGVDTDMIDTALHEIAHGLGMQALYESDTGDLISGAPSAFMSHVLDLDTGKHFDEMTSAERLASQVNARRVVWSGARAGEASVTLFAGGVPSVESEQVPTLSGFAADAAYGTWSVATTVSGELAADTSGACPPPSVNGRIVLMPWDCAHSSWASSVELEGALAIVVESPGDWDVPVGPLEEPMPAAVGIPVVAVSTADFTRFIDAVAMGTVTVQLSIDEAALLGADADGRVLLNVTQPSTASSVSHLEPLARPNLLMEPLTAPRTLHDLDITPAIMRDLGWAPFCGNGDIDQDEDCDDGDDNDDSEPNACRTSCVAAGCGDGVLDDGEACDDGDDNDDTAPNACRETCVVAFCGDGVLDDGEACDDARNNSNTMANRCRTTCIEPGCGDGVVDSDEECDDGADNSDTAPSACRTTCAKAGCGDGVIDTGEACDDGPHNSDVVPGACRTSCMPEGSDDQPDASVDGDGSVGGDGDGDGPSSGGGGSDDGGCGCRVAQRSDSGERALASGLALLALLVTRRRRARG